MGKSKYIRKNIFVKLVNKKRVIIVILVYMVVSILLYCRITYVKKEELYRYGIEKLDMKEYQEAIDIFMDLGNYKDSFEYLELVRNCETYSNAVALFENENYEKAIELFTQIENYANSKEYIEKSKYHLERNYDELLFNEAYDYYVSKNYRLAIQKFLELNDYKDSEEMLQKCRIELARLKQATTISAGIRSSAGVVRNGKVYLAGNDYYSWKSELETWTDIVSISVKGDFVVGLKYDGTVVTAGKIPEYYVETKTWSDVIAISTGQQHIIGLRSDGTLVAQGHNGDGQANIDDWHDIIDIATGWRHTVGLDSKGDIYITGYGSESQIKVILDQKDDWKNIIAIDAGGGSSGDIETTSYTVALKEDGTVVTTLTGEMADEISKWDDIIAVSAGDLHIVGLKQDGTVVTTQIGQVAEEVSEWTDIVAVSAGYGFTLGLKADGTVVAVGYNQDGQIDVDSWENITIYQN